MEPELPDTLSRYFAAQNEQDAERMTRCFAPDAVVRDEGRTYAGRDAIREWKRDTIARYGVSVRPLSSTAGGSVLTVVARVEGNFPGSPADLTYAFTLGADGLIRALEIH
jgi:ketosteroid isomerase-like protein